MKLPQIGPAFLITAAFIGPGTIITASLAGANYGYALLWALLFSMLATIILQEMTARLGIITQQGLGENIRNQLQIPWIRNIGIFLVVSAIVVGNAAYQGGNLSGASLGLSDLAGNNITFAVWPVLIGSAAFFLLWTGSYKLIEKTLISLVALMSIAFVASLIIAQPNLSELFDGLFIPRMPEGSALTIIALIGTTVVPYNLFLHASSVGERWKSTKHLIDARRDLYLSVPLGALISMAILSTAATAFFGNKISIKTAADLAPSLEPLFGSWSSILMAIGLFAAGLSSAVTAPLAAAYALKGVLGLGPTKNISKDMINENKQNILLNKHFKAIWIVILALGVAVASSGYKPISIIWFAQVANGILLPLITLFLLWIMNTNVMGKYRNNLIQNILGGIIFLVTLLLSGKSLMLAFSLT